MKRAVFLVAISVIALAAWPSDAAAGKRDKKRWKRAQQALGRAIEAGDAAAARAACAEIAADDSKDACEVLAKVVEIAPALDLYDGVVADLAAMRDEGAIAYQHKALAKARPWRLLARLELVAHAPEPLDATGATRSGEDRGARRRRS